MADLSRFAEYYKLADVLVGKASKEELAECARLLALNLAHYQGLYGEVPLSDILAMVDAPEPNDEQAGLLADGMEILVGVLGNVVSGLGGGKALMGSGNLSHIAAESLAVRIKRLRLAGGLTQGQLGALIGISGAAVGRLETGEYLPKGRYVAKLAQALSINVSALLGETPTSIDDLAEEVQLLAASRVLPKERKLIALKLLEALK